MSDLNKARVLEAIRRSYATYGLGALPTYYARDRGYKGTIPYSVGPRTVQVCEMYQQLIDENWQPVDPDLIEAREQFILVYFSTPAADVREGRYDDCYSMKGVVAGIKRGRELANETK